ncbi:hypothetical protein ACFVSN_40485 [Kitasatospora sp. NPDC057904]|uniref:hypothetical protein n=1 Tax=unclassified Kitasatospora TaxID=2633591 RepID=UPI0036D89961
MCTGPARTPRCGLPPQGRPGGQAPATEYTNGGLIPYAGGLPLRDELAQTGITVQTVNPGAYLTGFNDRIADTAFRWLDDTVNFNRTEDVKARFAEILADQYDPQDMIDKMVEIIGAEHGKYRNVWPPATEELIKRVQATAWTRTV